MAKTIPYILPPLKATRSVESGWNMDAENKRKHVGGLCCVVWKSGGKMGRLLGVKVSRSVLVGFGGTNIQEYVDTAM